MSDLAVHCLSTGRVRGKLRPRGVRRYLPGGWQDETLPVNAFLVEHPAGLCLFDTGQTARAARRGHYPFWHPFFRLARFELEPADEVAAQLHRLGHDPTAVRRIVLSHLHTDHVGAVASFPDAEVVVSRREWGRANGIRGRLRGYLPQHWPQAARLRLVEPEGESVGPFAATFDLAGDGRLLVVPLPGHTPGHVGLLVRNENVSYLLGGDAAVGPALADYCRRESVVFLGAHDPRAAELVSPARPEPQTPKTSSDGSPAPMS
jgi:glyoxylase-like metal-dependent hydrolase (beta-lactamase superfamily II)